MSRRDKRKTRPKTADGRQRWLWGGADKGGEKKVKQNLALNRDKQTKSAKPG